MPRCTKSRSHEQRRRKWKEMKRSARMNETPEERGRRQAADREHKRRQRAEETPEDRELHRATVRQYTQRRRAKVKAGVTESCQTSVGQSTPRRHRAGQSRRKAEETSEDPGCGPAEETEDPECGAAERAPVEPMSGSLEQRRKKWKEMKRNARMNETAEEREHRRLVDRERKRRRRAGETAGDVRQPAQKSRAKGAADVAGRGKAEEGPECGLAEETEDPEYDLAEHAPGDTVEDAEYGLAEDASDDGTEDAE